MLDSPIENRLKAKALEIREDVVRMLVTAGSGHIAGSLGMADVFTALYFGRVVDFDPQNPTSDGRDRVVLSNGHICPVLYATLAHAGYFPDAELDTLRKFGSMLQGHPHRLSLPGIETSSGPLGSGLSQAAGMAFIGKKENQRWRVYCIGSDGEHQEGNWWEGAMFAAKYKLKNLTAIVDRNNIQIDGYTEDVMPLESIRAKYEAFNWHVLEVDGHNYEMIIDAIGQAKVIAEKPTVIIAHTIPGRDIEFMESLPEWHGRALDVGDAVEALAELRTLGGKIDSDWG